MTKEELNEMHALREKERTPAETERYRDLLRKLFDEELVDPESED